VDDFESYNDLEPTDPASKRIFNVWIDGYGVATNGSVVGYGVAPFCEQTIVHGGKQSMPLAYSNTGGAVSGQLYVKVNGSKVTYDGQASNLAQAAWQAWNIDLASFGAGLQNVTKLAIGVDGNGASGTFYVDDIGLYTRSRELITPSAPDNTRLIGHWKLDEGAGTIASDSSGLGNDGTLGGNPQWVAGIMGGALDLDGISFLALNRAFCWWKLGAIIRTPRKSATTSGIT